MFLVFLAESANFISQVWYTFLSLKDEFVLICFKLRGVFILSYFMGSVLLFALVRVFPVTGLQMSGDDFHCSCLRIAH